MRWIRIEKAEPFSIKYRTTFLADMPFGVLNIQKKRDLRSERGIDQAEPDSDDDCIEKNWQFHNQ